MPLEYEVTASESVGRSRPAARARHTSRYRDSLSRYRDSLSRVSTARSNIPTVTVLRVGPTLFLMLAPEIPGTLRDLETHQQTS
jgi:hypothetical protein